jgi:hypothetical protein
MHHRQAIKSGDLLIWKKSKKSLISNWTIELIRFFTRSDFAHVGIAWVMDGRVFVVEATQPVVRLTIVKDNDEFYHAPMVVEWSDTSEEYLIDKIGLKYGVFDAIRAFLGKTLDNDRRYQCAELANEFYKTHGIELGDAFTPSKLVEAVLRLQTTTIDFVSGQ